jgi:polyisoprenoid-binding protein YceI
MSRKYIAVLAFAFMFGIAATATAQTYRHSNEEISRTYIFDEQTEHITIIVESKAPAEDIVGVSRTAYGFVRMGGNHDVDFAVAVPVDSLKTGISLRDQHLASDIWLDAKNHPEIIFSGKSLRKLSLDRYRLYGTFEVRGIQRPLTADVSVQKIPRELALKAGLNATNWVAIRGSFKITLSDHGITIPDFLSEKISDTWTVYISMFAYEE